MKYIAFLAALIAALVLAPPAAAAADWAWPVRGDVVTPYKNGDDPYAGGQHRGIDIAAPVGARVNAAVGGRVTFAGTAGGSGLTVNVRTGDGRFDVSYLHLSSASVHEGDDLDRGEPLGAVGTSGRRSVDQPHLHFGVREAGDDHAYRDPLDFLPPPAPPVTDAPPASPVNVPDAVAAPPAPALRTLAAEPGPAASAPAGEPAPTASPQLTTDALAPLPSASAVLVTADAVVPESGAPAGTRSVGEASGHGSTSARSGSASRGDASATFPRGTHAAPASNSPPAARVAGGSQGRPAGAAREHASPSHRTIEPNAVRGTTERLVSRSDLASPAKTPRADISHPRPRLHVGDPRTVRPTASSDSLNIGWLAAVIGLITASLCLSRPKRARHAARTGRSAIGAVLRPLTGRG